jgi:hypothetical protein
MATPQTMDTKSNTSIMKNNISSNEIGSSAIAIPLVDLSIATRESKSRLHALRKTPAVRAGKEAVVDKHASRKTLRQPNKSKSAKFETKQQLGFNF